MAYWLFKTEPDEFGIVDLANSPQQTARWDGIRNFQARNFLRDQVQLGDQVFIYHGKIKAAGIVGLAEVITQAYPDPAQFDPQSPYWDEKSSATQPRWYCVDLHWQTTFTQPVLLEWIKQIPDLAAMVLLKQGRLSVQPVSTHESRIILLQAGQPAP